jgi:hypothetical protein
LIKPLSRDAAETIAVVAFRTVFRQLGDDERPLLRVPVESDQGFRWKMIAQSGGT